MLKFPFSKKLVVSALTALLMYHASGMEASALYEKSKPTTQLKMVQSTEALRHGISGKGVRIAVVDTGINKNSHLLKNVVSRYTVTKNIKSTSWNEGDVLDRIGYGHGTGVAAIIGAQPYINKKGVSTLMSVAPDSVITSYKYKDGSQAGDVDHLVKAIQKAIQQKQQIISISSGLYEDVPELRAVIQKAISKNIIVVASAGNDAKNQITYPAKYDDVIAVSSVNNQYKRSAFANTGSGLDFVAPGENIQTIASSGDFYKANGTSFSTPYVTGLVALIKQQYPYISPKEVKAKLIQLSKDLGEKGYDKKYGYGFPKYTYANSISQSTITNASVISIDDHSVTIRVNADAQRKSLYVKLNNGTIYRTKKSTITIRNLKDETSYVTEIRSLDHDGNSSEAVKLPFQTLKDTTPPKKAQNIQVKVATNKRGLIKWRVVDTPDYAYAKIYLNGKYIGKSSSTSFATKVLQKKKTYRASVIIYDDKGRPSSTTVSKVIKVR